MYFYKTKEYYRKSKSNTTNGTGTGTLSPFVNVGLKLLNYYIRNDKSSFNNTISTEYTQVKLANPNYTLDQTNKVITYSIDNLYILNIINIDLNNQLKQLENACTTNSNNKLEVNTTSQNISQNTSIKLVYLQYLLMYDINETNGIFIDVYLQNATQVLNNNNGELVYNYNFQNETTD
jgi:hypothetical protein